MSYGSVVFTLDGVNTTIQCSQDEKMIDICRRFATKIGVNIGSLFFLYGGNTIHLETKFRNLISAIDRYNNRMAVLAYRNTDDEFACQKCGEKIKLNFQLLDDILLTNNSIKDTIIGIKTQLENMLISSSLSINLIHIQIKNIITLLATLSESVKKNNEKVRNVFNYTDTGNTPTGNNTSNIQVKIYKDGRYEGQLVNNRREGKGNFFYNDGNCYEGDWKNDTKDGKGIYYFNAPPYQGSKYEGDFKKDIKEGLGIYYGNNGNRYEGNWRKDKPEGKGVIYYNTGDRYEGDFKNGVREGRGIFYYRNGDREMGNYLQDMRIGKHVGLTARSAVVANTYS